MARKKVRKVKLASLIVVGEGAHDKAFINHMKSIYDGEKVKLLRLIVQMEARLKTSLNQQTGNTSIQLMIAAIF